MLTYTLGSTPVMLLFFNTNTLLSKNIYVFTYLRTYLLTYLFQKPAHPSEDSFSTHPQHLGAKPSDLETQSTSL